MKTSTVILIVAAGAAVLFIATRASAPPRLPVGTSTSSALGSLGSFLGGLVSNGGGLASLWGGGGQTNAGTYHADTSGFSISGNQLLDTSGNAVTYGTDY